MSSEKWSMKAECKSCGIETVVTRRKVHHRFTWQDNFKKSTMHTCFRCKSCLTVNDLVDLPEEIRRAALNNPLPHFPWWRK